MEFRLLGPFEARHDGAPVDLGDLQQRYVLAVLLLHANRPVSAERLIEIVWGAKAPSTNLVTGYIAKLRKAFRAVGAADEVIETTPTGYVLRVAEAQVDTTWFARLCAEAAAARRNADPARAIELLHEAIDLWRGRFLEDLDIDRIGGSEVVSPEDALIDTLGDLAELELAAGNHRWVRDRLRPVVQADPTRARAAILLMRALLANGDRVGAMKIYHLTRDALDEYGMDTSADLRGLAWLAQYGEQRSTLPPRPARFTGRAAELAAIEAIALAAADESRVVWLSGMPGVGKSALAVEAAHQLRDLLPDGQLLVALNGFTPNVEPTTPADALAALLGDLGVPTERIPPTMSARTALYQAKLHATRTLLVLDNALSEEQVRPLLPEAPGCLVIVTSRKVCEVEAADSIRLGPLPQHEAGELFSKLAGSDRVSGRWDQVNEVVARCGQLPLQIKVVASQFRRHDRWPLDHLVRLLHRAGPLTGFGDAGTVACMVSYQQLDDPQRTLFRLIGEFPGGDLDARGAAALADCAVARAAVVLDGLHAVSLLEETTTPGRYHMLDPIKEFAASVPPATPSERRAALERLLDYYLVTTSSAIAAAFPFDRDQQPTTDRKSSAALAFDDQQTALDWLTTERPNLVAGVRYAAGHGLSEHTWRLAVLLWRHFHTIGHLEDWIETLELAKQTVTADQPNRYGQAHVLLRVSTAHWRSGRFTQALELAAKALPLWVRLGDVRGEADTLCAIAVPTAELGDRGRAIAHFEAALAKYQEIGHQSGEAYALSMLGYLNELRGDLHVAHRQHLAAVRMLREVGYRSGLAHALDNLGTVELRLGRLDEAMASHEEAYAIAVDIGDGCVEAYALNYIGNVHRLLGNLDEAARYQEQAAAVANSVADAHLRTQLYLDRGATFRARGDLVSALRAYRAAFDLASGTGDRGQLAHANHGVARALHETGDHQRAAGYWRTAEAEFSNLGAPETAEIRSEREPLGCACGYPAGCGALSTPVSSG